MKKTQYQKYQKLLRIRDMIIAVVLVLVGIFYWLTLDGGTESGALTQYRAETVEAVVSEVGTPQQMTEASMDVSQNSQFAGEMSLAAETASGPDGMAASVNETTPTETAPETTEAQTASADSRINLNTASLEELDSLPGIGPATAKLILEYRQQYGGFAAPEEIKNVKRIGDKTYEKLKDYIRV